MKRSIVIAAFALLPVSRPVLAQSTDSTHQLGTVVVSATTVPRATASLSQAVTVISGDDLRARGVIQISDALREVPGAALVQNGSYGAVTTLFLRGGESRYTKVLIDGVPVNSSGGFFDFSHLTTDNIDRIEVVRGPASVLYGADAVSGIVQIFTRKRAGHSTAGISARAGTYDAFDATADVIGVSGDRALSLGAAHHASGGILPFNNQYRNGTLSSAVTLVRNASGEATITGRYTAAEFHYPTDYTGQPVDSNAYRTQHRLTVGLDVLRNLRSNLQARVLGGSNDVVDLTEDIATPFAGSPPERSAARSRGYRRSAEGRLTAFLPMDATLTLGAAYEREHENTSNDAGPVGAETIQTDYFTATRQNVAYYSELLAAAGSRLSYTMSGRVDDNSQYDRFATYRAGLSAVPTPRLKLRASVSSAFNAPAFNQVLPTLYTISSPNLRPEQAHSAEAGFTLSVISNVLTLGGSVFTQKFSDMIQYESGGPPDFKGSYSNLTEATSNGYEGELSVVPNSLWRASASFTVVAPKVTRVPAGYDGADNPGDALIRRPTHSATASTTFSPRFGASFGASATYVGKRPDLDFAQFPSPRVTLPAYTKVDLSAECPLFRTIGRGGLSLTLRVENVFDKRYEDVLHFGAPGRVILLGGRAVAAF